MSNNEWNINSAIMDNYLKCCKEAALDETIFNNFKQDPRYLPILEHVTYAESIKFIGEMGDYKGVLTEDLLYHIKYNDSLGNATLFDYDFFGKISPSTLRYVKNSLDIVNHFDCDDIKNIVEIGGGYGGLCKILHDFMDIESYTIVDIMEPLMLSKKYLMECGLYVNTITPNGITSLSNIDLVISNYAFSELSVPLQQDYIDNIILKTKKLYMTYNNISPNGLSCDSFCNILGGKYPNLQIVVEQDHQNNKLIYGVL